MSMIGQHKEGDVNHKADHRAVAMASTAAAAAATAVWGEVRQQQRQYDAGGGSWRISSRHAGGDCRSCHLSPNRVESDGPESSARRRGAGGVDQNIKGPNRRKHNRWTSWAAKDIFLAASILAIFVVVGVPPGLSDLGGRHTLHRGDARASGSGHRGRGSRSGCLLHERSRRRWPERNGSAHGRSCSGS